MAGVTEGRWASISAEFFVCWLDGKTSSHSEMSNCVVWHEREIDSVANITRVDISEFLRLAAEIPIHPEVQTYKREEANQALVDLKRKSVKGAKVLVME